LLNMCPTVLLQQNFVFPQYLRNTLYVSNCPPYSNTHGNYIYQLYRAAVQPILTGIGQKTVKTSRECTRRYGVQIKC